MNQQIVLALSLVLLALCVPSLAYVDGALPESCYNHEVTHTRPIIFTRYDLLPCPDPCFYQLDVKLVLNMSDINNVTVNDTLATEYDCGQMYQVNVKQTGNNAFQGFLVQARDNTTDFDSGSTIYGTWLEHTDLFYRRLYCNASMAGSETTFPNSATHKGRITATTEDLIVPLYWTPPNASSNPPTVAFWYTIVQQRATNFLPVRGPVLVPRDTCFIPTSSASPPSTSTTTTTAVLQTTPAVSIAPSTTADVGPTTSVTAGGGGNVGSSIGTGGYVGIGIGALAVIVILVVVIVVLGYLIAKPRNGDNKAKSRASVLWTAGPEPTEGSLKSIETSKPTEFM